MDTKQLALNIKDILDKKSKELDSLCSEYENKPSIEGAYRGAMLAGKALDDIDDLITAVLVVS